MVEDWENRWKEFKDPLIQEYGETIGSFISTFSPDEEGFYRVKALYEQIQNYFEGSVPEEIQNQFIQDFKKDYILENLQTHDWEKLYSKLCKEFGIRLQIWEFPRSGKDKDYFQVQFPRPLTEEEKKLCEKIATFFRYTISKAEGRIVSFEPEYPEEVKDELLKTDFVYHIMPLEDRDDLRDVESVEKNGFRLRNGRLRSYKDPKTGKREVDRYRNFTPRVYVYDLGERLAKTEEGRKDQFEELLYMKGYIWDECAIFAIDIHHFPGNFYRDTVAGDGKAAYTYQNIPADRVKRIH